jgi:hypothetical protein
MTPSALRVQWTARGAHAPLRPSMIFEGGEIVSRSFQWWRSIVILRNI